MKLNALRLHNVRRFGGRGVAIEGIGDGVNVLCAGNEFGKSTCFEALHALFFQPHTGTPKGVQMLRPYSGGNPLVEADIAIDGGRYRLTKQYYSGKRASVTDLGTGRLVAQADEAEAFIAELIRGGSAGPAGLLWVRQGMTGIEKRSNSEEENDKKVRESLLSSVQGEVEQLTGGRRMGDIVAACEAELAELVTATLKPKKGGPYSVAIEARDALGLGQQRLSGDVQALRAALDKRRAVRAHLADLENPAEIAARLAAIEAAEAAFEAAKSHSEALRIAEAEAALAANRHATARQQLVSFSAAMAQSQTLATQIEQARSRRDGVVKRRAEAVGGSDALAAELEQAEASELENRLLLARLDSAMRAREAGEQLQVLRTQLQQAEAARGQVEDGEGALAALSLPAKAVEQLQKIELELVALRARQEATLPTLRIDYAPGTAAGASIDGRPVPDAQDIAFANAVRLDIAGLGAITLRSNRPPTADAALDETQARHKALLDSLGVASLAAAHERQAMARERMGKIELARQRLNDLAPQGLAALQAEVARLGELSAAALEVKGDPIAVGQALAHAEQRVQDTRNQARALQPHLAQLANDMVTAETSLAGAVAELAGLSGLLGPAEDRAHRAALIEQETAQLLERQRQTEAKTADLRRAGHDLATADASLRRLRSVEDAAAQQLRQLHMTLAELNGTIQGQSANAIEEVLAENTDALAAANASVMAFETEIAVLDRLRRALAAARSAARDLYLKPVITELRPLLGLLFDDIAIEFDETTLLPQTVRRNGQDEDVDRLSGGMREQLSVLTRLAFARLLARDGRPAPVILDDALVYSDDDRIERMFNALHQQAASQQILVFSCRQRAFAKLGGNVLRMQDWVPPGL